jgi:L-asparaginase II
MQVTGGSVIAKLGAEGLLCLAIPDHGLGIAIRDLSGSSRALGPAAVAVLTELELEPPAVLDEPRNALCMPVQSFSGQLVGSIRPALQLRHPTPV